MNYTIMVELVKLVEQFEKENRDHRFTPDVKGFSQWVNGGKMQGPAGGKEPDWDGKLHGRSPESVISTLLVHMNRYAKTYSRSAIHGTDFSTQEEFIYLITLKAYGEMTKMELIRRNVQDKPSGMLIVNRLRRQGWVKQVNSKTDKRSKVLKLTPMGASALAEIKERIDKATRLVSGDLTREEQLDLIRLLQKLERFHQPIFLENIERAELLQRLTNLQQPPNGNE